VRDRRTLFLMCVVGFVAGYGAATISHTLPFARESMGLSEGGMFWIFGITRLVSLAGIGFALFADREGRRTPFLIAFALIPVGNLLTGLLPSPVTFTVGQSITRVGVVAVAALAVVILAEELTAERRALGLGIYALAGAMGAGLGLVILPLADVGDDMWRILFGFTTLGLLALPLLDKFLLESRAFARPSRLSAYAEIAASENARYLWTLAAMAFLVAAFASPAFDFVLERLINDLEWSTRSATWLLIFTSGLGTIGLIVGGRLADTVGRRPTTVAALGLGLIGGVAFYFVDTGWLLGAAVFVGTLGATMLSPAFAAHRSELFPTRVRATAGGIITNVAIVGSLTGFLIGALLVDSIGLPTTVAILGVGLLGAAYLVLQLPETKGKDLVGYAGEAPPVAAIARPLVEGPVIEGPVIDGPVIDDPVVGDPLIDPLFDDAPER
jgi:MFS family permease